MSKKVEIKPCPFCGKSDTESDCVCDTITGDKVKFYYVSCGNCGAIGNDSDTEEDAIETWNQVYDAVNIVWGFSK